MIITGNNLSASTWKMNGASILAKKIKEAQIKTPVFMWGLHVSALPERTLIEEPIEYVIKGEGLRSIVELTKFVIGGFGNPDNIKGLYYRKEDGTIVGNPNIALEINLDDIPMQALDLLQMEKYKAHNWHRFGESEKKRGYGVIVTSLGCPFNCTYCAISSLFGTRKVRYKSVDRVVEEIEYMAKKYKVYYIKILDENFLLNRDFVSEICDKLIKKGLDLNIWAYARVDTIDEDILKKIRKANVKWLCLGIESADENAMKNVNKAQYNNDKIFRVVKMIKDANINILANIMYGLPQDNMESMKRTLRLTKQLNCEWVNMYTTMAFPGSKLYEDTLKLSKEYLPESWLGYSELSYETKPLPTKYLTSEEVLAFRDYAFNEFFEENDQYFENIEKKFGKTTVHQIKSMTQKKLKRKLLGD